MKEKSKSINISIDRLILDDFPAVDTKAFTKSLQDELKRVLEKNANVYEWNAMYSTTLLDAGKINLVGDKSSQQLGCHVARQICSGLFRSKS